MAWDTFVAADGSSKEGNSVYLDTAATSRMIVGNSELVRFVSSTEDCNVRIRGSCGKSASKT